jgi:hypothetical protein
MPPRSCSANLARPFKAGKSTHPYSFRRVATKNPNLEETSMLKLSSSRSHERAFATIRIGRFFLAIALLNISYFNAKAHHKNAIFTLSNIVMLLDYRVAVHHLKTSAGKTVTALLA